MLVKKGPKTIADLTAARSRRRVQPPVNLDPAAAKIFCEIVASNSPDHFVASDAILLGSYCMTIIISNRCAAKMMKDPKLVPIWEKATRLLSQMAPKLRLCPSSRIDVLKAGRRARRDWNPPAWMAANGDDKDADARQ